MPRSKKTIDSNAPVSQVEEAQKSFDAFVKQFRNYPSAAHYNVMMASARNYQNRYIDNVRSQFSEPAPLTTEIQETMGGTSE